ncbi:MULTISPECIES: alkaline shock response membrane anchor protein AmaP [unclassified Streptomyces]|uniref:alkaline shock response membrane anchor protein AmaP n=1 Tax=unclassified Streptomyces TaxID=2593676 RepID=UPI0016557679|nr:alkaline shock response membrane anchor protein AmaP [Streptomyces sp. CB02980]MCB8904879.1 alkaline shock response membrane anchor protein AmaP [Streptomyces sp. CB02980]
MTVVLRRVNRVLLGLAGLLLVLAGGGVLAASLDLSVPHWWPWSGPSDVLLSAADRQRWRDEGWWWPVVIAVLGLVVLLALWWLLVQFRRARLAEVVVDSGDGEVAVLRGRALESVLEADATAQEGVAKAHVSLTGRRATPRTRVALLLEPYASPGAALTTLSTQALAHARTSTGLPALPTEARLRAVKHRARRVA